MGQFNLMKFTHQNQQRLTDLLSFVQPHLHLPLALQLEAQVLSLSLLLELYDEQNQYRQELSDQQ